MATVTGLTAERMLEIEAACIVDGAVVLDDLILTRHDGGEINAGSVKGPQGEKGDPGLGVDPDGAIFSKRVWIDQDAGMGGARLDLRDLGAGTNLKRSRLRNEDGKTAIHSPDDAYATIQRTGWIFDHATGLVEFPYGIRSNADPVSRFGEAHSKAVQHEFLQFFNATDGQDWSVFRPAGTRDLVFYCTATGSMLTLGQDGTIIFQNSPIAPTPTATDDSTKVATTAFVRAAKAVTFRAKRTTNQSIGASGWTVVVADNVISESNPGFYNPANGRFTPQIPGYYVMKFRGYYIAPGAWAYASLLKNGANIQRLVNQVGSGSLVVDAVADPVFLNGSTDYLTVGAQADTATSLYGDSGGETMTALSAFRIGG